MKELRLGKKRLVWFCPYTACMCETLYNLSAFRVSAEYYTSDSDGIQTHDLPLTSAEVLPLDHRTRPMTIGRLEKPRILY